jgi:cysteine dioxygenase
MDISVEECDDYIFWDKDHYTRNCIARTDEYELLLLCWEPGQGSAIHNHNKQECWVKVITGVFEETVFTYNGQTREMELVEQKKLVNSEITNMEEQSHFHKLTNVCKEPAVSLHLYMKPITKCQVYNKNTKSLTTLAASDFSKFGEVL